MAIKPNVQNQSLKLIDFSFVKVKSEEKAKMEEFFRQCHYVRGSYDKKSDFEKLAKELEKLSGGKDVNQVFYLALPPSVFKHTTSNIKDCCMTKK